MSGRAQLESRSRIAPALVAEQPRWSPWRHRYRPSNPSYAPGASHRRVAPDRFGHRPRFGAGGHACPGLPRYRASEHARPAVVARRGDRRGVPRCGVGRSLPADLDYRGFAASPVQGRPQGLAVYVNGMRFDQPFGDTVDWDLIRNNAIDRLNVERSDPVFGLNTLGAQSTSR